MTQIRGESQSPARDTRVFAVVAAGGAVGSVLRYAASLAFPDPAGVFPRTTFMVNILGCLAIGVLVGVLDRQDLPNLGVAQRGPTQLGLAQRGHLYPLLRPALGTGVLGGFTTFSAYTDQARALATGGHLGIASAYVFATLATALPAVAVGKAIGKAMGKALRKSLVERARLSQPELAPGEQT